MNITDRRTEIVLNYVHTQLDAEWVAEYGEPGYGPAEKGVLFANWNSVAQPSYEGELVRTWGRPTDFTERRAKFVGDYLEAAGYALEWSDEWYLDHDNSKAWRTSPDGYDWQCQVAYGDGFVLTPDDDITEWVDVFRDDYHRALPSRIEPEDLEDLGWTRVEGEDFENGWFPGQNDDPEEIYKRLIAEPNVLHVLFRLTENSQFYLKFDVWVMYDEEEETNDAD